jgi:O-methyltransferase
MQELSLIEDTSNTFILELQEREPLRAGPKSWQTLNRVLGAFAPIMRLFNRYSLFFKVSYAWDPLNDQYRIKQSFRSQSNMLQGGMLSREQAINIYHLLRQVVALEVPGDVVELGCYEGITSILIQKTLNHLKSPKALHVYDSFAGLPNQTAEDKGGRFHGGMLGTTKANFLTNFTRLGVKPPHIHEGWFKDTLPQQLPDKICFAHLDGDFYASIMESLQAVYPRLSPGAIVIIDDYCAPELLNVHNILPGVKRACDDFLRDKPEKVQVLLAGDDAHGYFSKQ